MFRFNNQICPTLITDAINDIVQETQAPYALVSSSVLGAVSAVTAPHIEMEFQCRRYHSSLMLVVIADSGERKNSVDGLVNKPIYEADKEAMKAYEEQYQAYRVQLQLWEAKKKTLENAYTKQIKKG